MLRYEYNSVLILCQKDSPTSLREKMTMLQSKFNTASHRFVKICYLGIERGKSERE